MKDFYYEGYLSASKSLMNRALIVQSFYNELEVTGQSYCEDVRSMEQALFKFRHGFNETLDCGAGGTTFRFLLARLSREPGEYSLTGTHRLLERPHRPLFDLLKGLGVEVSMEEKHCVRIKTKGWDTSKPLRADLKLSSQYCSALLLSAWELPEDLVIQLDGDIEKAGYLQMTLDFLKSLGMAILLKQNKLIVPAGQKIKTEVVSIEPDMSSVFALASFAAVRGHLKIFDFPSQSLQPDSIFLKLFEDMGVPAEIRGNNLFVKGADRLLPVDFSLERNPDLFPVLSVLLSRAHGESVLSDLDVLAHKESNRLENTMDLLSALGIRNSYQNKKLRIFGKAEHSYPDFFEFDPDQDHRMAMAAALARHQGASLKVLTPEVVDKSFPEFWGAISQ